MIQMPGFDVILPNTCGKKIFSRGQVKRGLRWRLFEGKREKRNDKRRKEKKNNIQAQAERPWQRLRLVINWVTMLMYYMFCAWTRWMFCKGEMMKQRSGVVRERLSPSKCQRLCCFLLWQWKRAEEVPVRESLRRGKNMMKSSLWPNIRGSI